MRVRSADTVLMSYEGSGTYGEFVNSSTASGSSTTVQARQTRPRSQFGQIRGLGLAAAAGVYRSCDFTAHMCTGIILSNYKLFVNVYLNYTYYINILEDAYGC